VKEVDWLC